jgi:hypothetical protein
MEEQTSYTVALTWTIRYLVWKTEEKANYKWWHLFTVLLLTVVYLKGQCHEIFCFWFFSWISFPQASDYTIRVVSNFFENSRRYSQLKVCHRCQRHRWQMEKTFKQKNFNNFIWTPLGSRVNIYISIFAFKFTLRFLQPDIVAIICHRYQQR